MKRFVGLALVVTVIFAAASLCGRDLGPVPKETKIAGSPWGYRTLHFPLRAWNSRSPAKRWTGKLSESIGWKQVERIRVVYQQLHIRDNAQIDSLIRSCLDESLLIKSLPDNARVDTHGCAALLRLQALLELKGGECVLVSIGGTGNPVRYPQWVIIEYRRKGVGLALPRRK